MVYRTIITSFMIGNGHIQIIEIDGQGVLAVVLNFCMQMTDYEIIIDAAVLKLFSLPTFCVFLPWLNAFVNRC